MNGDLPVPIVIADSAPYRVAAMNRIGKHDGAVAQEMEATIMHRCREKEWRINKAFIPDGAQRRSGIRGSWICLDCRVRGNDRYVGFAKIRVDFREGE